MIAVTLPRPAYYYGWNIVATTALCQAASYGVVINCLSIYIPGWSQDLNVPASFLTLCYTVAGVIFAVLAPLAGAASDRFSVRVMMTIGVLGVALLFGLASMVTEAWHLIALFATVAPFAMIVSGSLQAQLLVSRWFERRRGLAIGICALGQTAAGALLSPALAAGISAIGWRTLFLVLAAALACLCAPLVYLLLRDQPRTERGVDSELPSALDAHADGPREATATREILSRPNFWVLAVCATSASLMFSGVMVNMSPLAISRGLSATEAAGLLSLFSLTALCTKLVAGFAIDRIGGRIVMVAIFSCGVAGVILLRFAGDYVALLSGVLLVAGCGAITVPVATLVAREFGAASFGRAMGAIILVSLVSFLAPTMVAYLREVTQSYDAPFTLLAGAGILAIATASIFRPKAGDRHGHGAPR